MSHQPWSRRIQYESTAGFRSEHEIHKFENNQQTIIIAVDTDSGTSLTLSIENLISAFCNRYGVKPDIVIEHYPANNDDGEETETFEQVIFDWNEDRQYYENPRWEVISREKVEALIGQKLILDEAPSDAGIWVDGNHAQCYYCFSRQIIFWSQSHYCARCGNNHDETKKKVG